VVAIDDVALKYVKKKEGCFVVKTVLTPSGWCGGGTRNLWIEVLKNFTETEEYKCYEYKGVKIFIENKLILSEDVLIYERLNLPMVGRIFASTGIWIKNK
jgi:Pyruvate/2-oxoacid:ferredoxin oxidoreductase gamma subunit